MGQKSSRCWRSGNLRNKHSLKGWVQSIFGREYGIASEVVEGIQLIADHHYPHRSCFSPTGKSPPLDLPL
jgi:hypothetical protein